MTAMVVPAGEEQVVETVLSLVAATASLQGAGLGALSDAGLEAVLRGWEVQSRRAEAAARAALGEVMRRGLASARGCTSEVAYLRALLNVSTRDACRRVQEAEWLEPRQAMTGEQLPPRYPALAAASGEAAITGAHVAAIARKLDALPFAVSVEKREEAEKTLTDHARHRTPEVTGRLATLATACLDPDGVLATERDQRDQTSVKLSKGLHGMWHLRGDLDPESGALLKTALDAASKPVPGPDGERDPRDAGKRQADALVQMAKSSLDRNAMPCTGGRKPQLVLTTTLAEFQHGTGLARTQWGDLLTAETTAKLACDAEISVGVLDQHGAVLNLGRTERLISPDQRRALNLRDRGCIFPGCDRPPAWCQGHHIEDWIKGGATDLDNLCLLCSRHHTEVHKQDWQIQMINGRPHCVPPKWIDPDQVPRQNRFHDHEDLLLL